MQLIKWVGNPQKRTSNKIHVTPEEGKHTTMGLINSPDMEARTDMDKMVESESNIKLKLPTPSRNISMISIAVQVDQTNLELVELATCQVEHQDLAQINRIAIGVVH